MKKHEFKKGDGVILTSHKDTRRLLKLAMNNGYPIYEESIKTLRSNFYWDGYKFIGCAYSCIETQISEKEFISLITEPSERQDFVVLPAEELRRGYTEANESIKLMIDKHVNFKTGRCSKEGLRKIYKSVCLSWQRKIEEHFPWIKESSILNTVTSLEFGHCNINNEWAFSIYEIEEQGNNGRGQIVSGHRASIFLANCNGDWYDEKGNVINGYIYYKPLK